jgi:hypothetical protein
MRVQEFPMRFDGQRKIAILVLAIVSPVTCLGQKRGAADVEAAEGPGGAIVAVRIEFDPSVLTFDEGTVNNILDGVRVMGRATQKVLGLGPAARRGAASVSLVASTGESFRSGDFMATLVVNMIKPELNDKAPELARVICQYLEEELCALHDRKLERARKEVERAKERVDRADGQVDAILEYQNKLQADSGLVEMNREAALKTLHELEERQQELEIQLVAANARERAIATQIASTAKAAEERAKNDPVAAELEKVVAVREQELGRVSKVYESGAASVGDSLRAIEGVALARAELVKARAAATQAAGGELLGKLNGELVHIAIDSAEAQARLGTIRGRLEELRKRKTLELVDRYAREERRLPQVRLEAAGAADAYQRLKSQLGSTRRPEVIVLEP